MASKEYNGHKNWNCWNVSLWLSNDEGLYRMVKYHLRTGKGVDTKDEIARNILRDLEDRGMRHTPDGANFNFSAVREAIKGDF